MKEIKFRAWDNITKAMYRIRDIQFTADGEAFSIRLVVAINDDDFEFPVRRKGEFELMQFAGQLNIYEGDILSKKWKAEVFKNDEGTFMVNIHTNSPLNKSMSLKKFLRIRKNAGTLDSDSMIIGNIFSNPELLNK